MTKFYDNLIKTLTAGTAALAVTWVMSYGFIKATDVVRGGASFSPVVAVINN